MNPSWGDIYDTVSPRKSFKFYFSWLEDEGTYRIYIIKMPRYPLGMRTDFHSTHRLRAVGEDYDYICFTGKMKTPDEAMDVASLWADVTARMMATRRPFDDILSEA